jgi:hypothetical protein
LKTNLFFFLFCIRIQKLPQIKRQDPTFLKNSGIPIQGILEGGVSLYR